MLAENEEISGEGGVLVLGQEQDSPGGHFSGMSTGLVMSFHTP